MPSASQPDIERKRQALELFSGLPRHYDLVAATLSFGQDPRWRRALVRAIGPTPADRILDVATGTGLVAAELVRHSGCQVVGLDQSPEMLGGAHARLEADPELRHHIELIRGEAEHLPFPDSSFDALTFTYLLRYVEDPQQTLNELARVVKPGGRIGSLEFCVPNRQRARWAWRFYTAIGLPTLGALLSREWREVGSFLGPSIRGFYQAHPLAEIVSYWHRAGLENVQVELMSLGGGVVISATKAENAGRA